MKKSLLTMCMVVASCILYAQGIGVHANVIFPSNTFGGDVDDSKTRVSWKVGLVADAPISENFRFMPQLNLLSKGGKEEEDGDKMTTNLTYIELPLNFVYSVDGGTGFFAGAGPSVSAGLGGKVKYDYEDGDDEEEDVEFGGDDNLKRFELGANILLGFRMENGFFVHANYNLGLTNLVPDGNNNGKFKNNYFGVGVGIMLGGK